MLMEAAVLGSAETCRLAKAAFSTVLGAWQRGPRPGLGENEPRGRVLPSFLFRRVPVAADPETDRGL
jgi:hypothetical protein